jgi:hypothetical protein
MSPDPSLCPTAPEDVEAESVRPHAESQDERQPRKPRSNRTELFGVRHPHQPRAAPEKVSDQIDRWLATEGEKTLGGLIDVFQEKSFALIFILLLGVPALPLPTGGATHVFEIIAILVALQLVVGRDTIWLPKRWCRLDLGTGGGRTRLLMGLTKAIRRIERFSRPRLRFLFDHRASNSVFGLLAIAGSLGAFLAPPFTGLDTLPALGVVLLSLGVLLEDFFVVVLAVIVGAAGVFLEIVLGKAALSGIQKLF